MTDCIFCEQNGETAKATHLAPQDNGDGTWELVPVCPMHLDGWWDGSGYPDGIGAPEAQPIA